MEQHILSILVANRFGVLTKVTTMFSHRGCNIHSLTVCTTHRPDISRITVTVMDQTDMVRQIYSQLSKLEDVREVSILSDREHVERTFVLIQMKPGAEPAPSKWADQGLFIRCTRSKKGIPVLEALGPTDRIDALIESLGDRVEQLSRSGCTAMGLESEE